MGILQHSLYWQNTPSQASLPGAGLGSMELAQAAKGVVASLSQQLCLFCIQSGAPKGARCLLSPAGADWKTVTSGA